MNSSFIHWNVSLEILNLMGFSLRYYGVLFAGGIFLSAFILRWMFKKENTDLDKLDTCLHPMFIEALAAGIAVKSPQLRASKLARGLVAESPAAAPSAINLQVVGG